ncbi:MAG TPA: hypothetical protein VF516_46885 [Kofleriaceae bacterium]
MATSNPTIADGSFEARFQVQGDPTSPSPCILLQAVQGERQLPCRPAVAAFQGVGPERRATGQVVLVESADTLNDLNVAEIGQGLASVVGSIQQELGQYPVAGGVYVLDELELNVPVRLRVDHVGQIRASVLPERSDPSGAELRLKIRPVLDVPVAAASIAAVPLEALDLLSKRQIAYLRELRVFDVASLLRLATNPMNQATLKSLRISVDKVRERAELLLYAGLPDSVARILIEHGVASVQLFLSKSPEEIRRLLTPAMQTEISLEDIEDWQTRLRAPRVQTRARDRLLRHPAAPQPSELARQVTDGSSSR